LCVVISNSVERIAERIEFIESEKTVGLGEGGRNEDDEYVECSMTAAQSTILSKLGHSKMMRADRRLVDQNS